MAARRYAAFLEAVAAGRRVAPRRAAARGAELAAPEASRRPRAGTGPEQPRPEREASHRLHPRLGRQDEAAREYIETHQTRLDKTLEITPPGGPGDRILEMGAYLQITPALRTRLGYGEVRGCYYGRSGAWTIAR